MDELVKPIHLEYVVSRKKEFIRMQNAIRRMRIDSLCTSIRGKYVLSYNGGNQQ